MAEGKKGFILYADLIHTVKQLSDLKAGKLFKHILRYVNDEYPESKDPIINISFEPIKQSLKRDLKRYENICQRNRINGKKGGRPKNPKEPKKPTGIFGNPKEPKKPDSDNDNDNERDNVIINAFTKNVKEVAKELSINNSILSDFLDHWTEKDYENKCFAWQVPETFIIKSRLKGWKQRSEKDKPIDDLKAWK